MEKINKKPIIGISSSIMIESGSSFAGYERTYVNRDYSTSVYENGGVPLVIPMLTDPDALDLILSKVDGIILSGGHDITPQLFGEEPKPLLGDTCLERDEFELLLIELAKKRRLPILGICRGHQLINVYEGGTLYQNLTYSNLDLIRHWQEDHPRARTHKIQIKEDSKLFSILGESSILVNSFHRLGVKEVAPSLRVVAKAQDGVIEALEHKDYPFMLSVQWHPEMLAVQYKDMAKIFKSLIEEASK